MPLRNQRSAKVGKISLKSSCNNKEGSLKRWPLMLSCVSRVINLRPNLAMLHTRWCTSISIQKINVPNEPLKHIWCPMDVNQIQYQICNDIVDLINYKITTIFCFAKILIKIALFKNYFKSSQVPQISVKAARPNSMVP